MLLGVGGLLSAGEASGACALFDVSAGLLLAVTGLSAVFLSGDAAALGLGAGKGGNCTHSLLLATDGVPFEVLLTFGGVLSSGVEVEGAAVESLV